MGIRTRFKFEFSFLLVLMFDVAVILSIVTTFIFIDNSLALLKSVSPNPEWEAWLSWILKGFYSYVACCFSVILAYQTHRLLKRRKIREDQEDEEIYS